MAHEIEIKADGTASMFSARLTPWHRLGVVTPDVLTAEDAIKAGGLDWTVEKAPVFKQKHVVSDDGVSVEFVEVKNRFVLERSTDQLDLAVVSDVYKPFQNRQAFSFMDHLVDSGEAKYETAGSLREGRVIFVSMETPKHIVLPGDDEIKTYLLLRTTHDGSGKIMVYVVTVRVVCMNTLTWAINGAKYSFGFTHTADVEGKIAQARESLQLAFKYEDAFEEEAKSLIDIKVTDDEIVALLEGTLPQRSTKDAEIEAAMSFVRGSANVQNFTGTAWGALNGITEYYEHGRPNRSSEALFARTLYGEQTKLRSQWKDRLLAKA